MISNFRKGLLVLAYLPLAILLLQDIWANGQGTDIDIWGRIALSAVVLAITCPLFALAVLSLCLKLNIILLLDGSGWIPPLRGKTNDSPALDDDPRRPQDERDNRNHAVAVRGR